MPRGRFLLPLLGLLPACGGREGDDNIYGMEQGDQAEAVTLGNDELDGGSSGSSTTDAGTTETSTSSDDAGTKLDTLPDDGVADGPDPMDCIEDVDIVFVMDVSTTMGPFFDKLESEIGVVHDALMQYDLPNPPHYGLVVFVDDFKLVDAGVPYTDINALKADFAYWNNFTASNQQTNGGGFNSTWTENSLDALFAAAVGFQWRPAASTLRMIVHTTDDTFWNGPINANGVDILHNYPETVDQLQAKQIRMFTFAADKNGGQCECEDVSMGFFSNFQGQPPIPMQTGGAAYLIDDVLAGITSLSTAINGAVEDSYCEDYPPVD